MLLPRVVFLLTPLLCGVGYPLSTAQNSYGRLRFFVPSLYPRLALLFLSPPPLSRVTTLLLPKVLFLLIPLLCGFGYPLSTVHNSYCRLHILQLSSVDINSLLLI